MPISVFKPAIESDVYKGTIAPGAALPVSPLAGWYINRSDTGYAERYNGTAWVAAPQHNLDRDGEGTSAQMMAADTWVNEWKNTDVDRWFDKNANGDWIQRASGHDVVEQLQVVGLTSALAENAAIISDAPTYADDAAAGVGGLTVGDVYVTAGGAVMRKQA